MHCRFQNVLLGSDGFKIFDELVGFLDLIISEIVNYQIKLSLSNDINQRW